MPWRTELLTEGFRKNSERTAARKATLADSLIAYVTQEIREGANGNHMAAIGVAESIRVVAAGPDIGVIEYEASLRADARCPRDHGALAS
jgi:hypothetical protein